MNISMLKAVGVISGWQNWLKNMACYNGACHIFALSHCCSLPFNSISRLSIEQIPVSAD
jgi:hypothetical protein